MKKDSKLKNFFAAKKTKPDLSDFMIKVQEQLAALERKIDAWIGQVPTKFVEVKAQPALVLPVLPPHRPGEVPGGQGHRERVLHKAVCADCHKDCEIPFKPSGERPVYCKACFSKRKSGGPAGPRMDPKQGDGPQKRTGPAVQPNRQVIVTKKGVGKVTVSEIVRSPAHDVPVKAKSDPSGGKPRRA